MKFITFLFILFLVGCKPFSLDDTGRDKDRLKDDKGRDADFEIPDIIDLDEIRDDEKCQDYVNHTSQSVILGDLSVLNPIVNCIAYYIDEGLKPLCALEEEVKEAVERERNDRKREELEAVLNQIENEKDNHLDYLYDISDPVFETCGDVEDLLADVSDDIEGKNDKIYRRLAATLFNLGVNTSVNSECPRLYRVIESRVNLACSGVSFFFNSRRRK